MHEDAWPRIAVVGAGAVGCYYGGMLARAGAPVTLVGRAVHVDAIRRDGLTLEIGSKREQVDATAATDVAAIADARIVLVCVKSGDTEATARAMAPHLARDALVVSLQNGVDNARRMRPLLYAQVLACVVYVGCEMAGPGHVRHMGRGDLVVGGEPGSDAAARAAADVAAHFVRAGVPCTVSADIDADLWGKLIVNCAYNPLSALTRLPYGPMTASPWSREIMPQVVAEAIAVAHADGVRLRTDGLLERVLALGASMPGQISSTAQDIGHGKATEIDALNGYVARRGEALGVPTPVNRTLHALVKLLEIGVARR
ncbi:MAG: 2-dehydropantoate 2-reductase [Burkholderiales bacterium]